MKTLSAVAALSSAALLSLLLGCGTSSPSSASATQGSGSSGGATSATLTVTSVSPASIAAGSAASLTVTGTGFTTSTAVQVNATQLPTTYVSSTQVTAAIAAGQFANATVMSITVSDKGVTAPGSTATLEVDNPLPAISGMNPSSAVAGAGAASSTVAGTGFLGGTIIRVNGVARPTAYTSATQVVVTLDPTDLTAVGTLSVTASNPAPGGGVSPSVAFAVVNPAPGAITVSPSTMDGGGTADTPLTIFGSNFVASSVVQIGGTARATSYVSSTQLRAALTAADQATARSLPVFVITPAPGGGSTAPAVVTINANPLPVLSSVSPALLVAGTGITLHIFGSGFISSSSILWNGAALTTQFVSATELTAFVDANLDTSAGTATITVNNPPPAGGQSAAFPLPINSATPTLSSVSPAIVFRSSTNTVITLNGTGYQPASKVLWNGNPYTTTFISSTQLSITVPQADVPTASTATLQVTTPSPGGGASATLSIPVYVYKPVINAVSEAVTTGLCQQISLHITGQYLPQDGLIVRLNGTPISNVASGGTTFIVATLPPGFTSVANPTLTVEFSPIAGEISDPFTLLPVAASCVTPGTVVAYPGTTVGINVVSTVLGSAPQPVVSTLTLPAGFSAVSPAPYTSPARILVAAGASIAAGSYALGLNVTGTRALTANIPVTVKTTAPVFSFSTPATSEVLVPIGGSTSFSVSTYSSDAAGTPDFLITLAAAGLPAGLSASFQPAKVLPGDTATVTLTADATAAVRQNVALSITGTVDGSTTSATAAYTLDVERAPGNIPNNRAAFTATGATPAGVAYDRVHNLIFASNAVWNRIDVISNLTHAIVRSIPIASPAAIDLSQDNGTLWIGTNSQQVFALNTSTFALQKYVVPQTFATNSNISNWVDQELFALSNGNLLMVVYGNGGGVLVWSPSTGTATPVNMTAPLVRSRDGSRVFGLTSSFSGCQMNVYSATAASLATYTIDSGFTGSGYCGVIEAANNDGSILATNLTAASLRGIQLINATGQSLGSFTAALAPGILSTNEGVLFSPQTFVFSDDGRTLYQTGSLTGRGNLVATYDVASRGLLGLAPAIAPPTSPLSSGYGGNTALVAADTSGVLIGMQNYGVAFEDSTYFQDYGTGSTTLVNGSPSSFSPQSGPLSGGTTFSTSAYVALQPDAWFGDIRGGTGLSTGFLSLTSPAGIAPGPVNLKLIYPNGEMGFAADGFSYGPYPQNIVYGGSSPAGGALSTVTGFGLPVDSSGGSVSVGGTGATITSTAGQYPPWTGEAVPSTFFTFTLPAGKPGFADLQVQTPNGTGTLPRAVFYAASVNNYSFTGTASALVYDKFRKRTYVIASNSVLVFAAGAFQSPLAVPTINNIYDLRDGALSVDGNYLLVGNVSDGSVAVVNLATPGSSYAMAIPELSATYQGCATGPGSMAALSAGRALVLPFRSGSQCTNIRQLAMIDIQARSRTILSPFISPCNNLFDSAQAQGNGDGTQVVLKTGNNGGACFYSPDTGFGATSVFSAFYTAAISADGNLLGGDTNLFDTAGKSRSKLAQPPALYGTAIGPTYPANPKAVTLRGSHFNASGGLEYVPHAGYFEIVDTLSDTLRMRFSLTQTLQDLPDPLAVDEGGRQVFLLTDAGLTVVDMGEAPLSVGHLGAASPVSGGTIQVRGSGFDAGIGVTVDAAAAVVTLVDENTLTVSLPALSSGPHDMTLSRGHGSTLTVKGLISIP